jgi:replicative DNA helicase
MTMPCDLKSEQLLLARMLSSINSVNEAMESLTSEDFQDPVHRLIFSSMCLLYSRDCEIEPVSVAKVMKDEFPKECNVAYVFGLEMHKYGDHEEVKLFIQSIIEKSRLRKMIHLGQLMTKEASENRSSEEIQNQLISNLETIFTNLSDKSTNTLEQLIKRDYCDSGKNFLEYVEHQMKNRMEGVSQLRGIPTGFSLLDNYLSGLSKGHYIIVGARPGVGKTTLILNIIKNLLFKDVSVGFFSLEMTSEQVMGTLIQIEANVNLEKAQRGEINQIENMNIFEATKRIEKLKLVVDDQECLFINQLIARTKRMVYNHKIEVLFIDYLGEIKGNGKFGTKQEEIQSVSKALRGLAKKLKIPIVCVCQLNRNNEKENRIPRKSDLRESGQIEADAHSILLLHRPSSEDDGNQNVPMQCFIVKNRFGREGSVHFGFDGEKGKFLEIDYKRKNEDE